MVYKENISVVKVKTEASKINYMSITDQLKKLRDDWKLITSVAKKPDKETLSYSIKLTFLVMAVVGILAYIIQLTATLIIH